MVENNSKLIPICMACKNDIESPEGKPTIPFDHGCGKIHILTACNEEHKQIIEQDLKEQKEKDNRKYQAWLAKTKTIPVDKSTKKSKKKKNICQLYQIVKMKTSVNILAV